MLQTQWGGTQTAGSAGENSELQNQRGELCAAEPGGENSGQQAKRGVPCATDPVVGGRIRWIEGRGDRHTAWLGENITGETESGRTVGVGENGQVGTEEAHRQERKEIGGRDEGQ